MNLATLAYGTAALGFLVLNVLLLIGRRADPFGHRLSLASLLSALWAGTAGIAALTAFNNAEPIVDTLEVARDAGWLVLLTGVFARRVPRWLALVVQVAWVSLLVAQVLHWTYPAVQMTHGGLALALLGLVLLEQIYRNSAVAERDWLKYLLFGIGGQFAYDLFLYAQSELLGAIDATAWSVRGVALLLAVPLIVLAVRNSVASSASIFISRHVIFYSTALAAVGIYLCAMAVGGYYIRFFGGTWGEALQLFFLLGAAAVLVSLLWSAMLSRRLRVFISKHFYRNKYDYRVEWLRFVHTLSSAAPENVPLGALQAVAQVFSSPQALLFVADEAGRQFRATASWSDSGQEIALPADVSESADLVQFMQRRSWIIDLDEYRRDPATYENIQLPPWLSGTTVMSIVAPITQGAALAGFVVMARPPPPFELTYEDRDLLTTMGRHVATHLAQQEANRKLAENRQFETYSRLTAFMMHDLKNSAAQLRLVVSNAVKFRHQPEFVDDAMATIDNAAQRMTRLLDQLRLGAQAAMRRPLKLQDLIEVALARCAANAPVPVLASQAPGAVVEADQEHLTSVIEHVVRNAQDATPAEGEVRVEVSQEGSAVRIVVSDTGRGMEADFLRDRLFRPFDTTKGAAGMGIGAHQAREYVRSLGGHVDVQSSPGQGTRFAITLPALLGRTDDG
jgi:putative PEP-CTERM system histidine kinase